MNSTLSIDKDSLASVPEGVVSAAISVGLKIIIAAVILLISFRTVTVIARKIEKRGEKSKLDKTIMRTLAYIFNIGVKTLIVICLIGYLGIDTSGIAALLASLGVGIGLAVNGALSNLAGGVLIIATRPFRIDDFIEAQGVTGTVEDIHMVCTKVRTPDNKVVYIPNGELSGGNIINYSEKSTRRLEFKFNVSYSSDVERAKALIYDVIASHGLTLAAPEPLIKISACSNNGIEITARAWVNREDYWTVNFDVIEAVKRAFDGGKIEIPFNQIDVHLKNS